MATPSFLSTFETSITTFFTSPSSPLSNASRDILLTFQSAFIAGMTVWVMAIAYGVAFGKSEDGMTYVFGKFFRMFLIGTLALYGWTEVSNLLDSFRQDLMQSVSGSPTIAGVLDQKIIGPLIDGWQQLLMWLNNATTGLDIFSIGTVITTVAYWCVLAFAYGCTAFVSVGVCVVALAVYLVGYITFQILLAVGPLFLMFLAFPFTQRFFETYIGNVLTATLVMAFTALIVALAGYFLDFTSLIAAVSPVGATGGTGVPMTGGWLMDSTKPANFGGMAIDLLAMAGKGLLLVYCFYKIFDMASALGGGLNMGNNMVGAMRNLAKDALAGRLPIPGANTGGGNGGMQVNNSINAGRGGAGNAPRQVPILQAMARRSTLTGMAATGVALGVTRTSMAIGRTVANSAAGRATGRAARGMLRLR